MSSFFDDAPKMSREELLSAFEHLSENRMPVDPWEPKVLEVTPDGGKVVSTLDWLRLRRDNTDGSEGDAAVTLAHETYKMAKAVAEEQQSGLSAHVRKQKDDAKVRASAIVAYVLANPRGSLKKTSYVNDVAKACGVGVRKVYDALKEAAVSF